MGSADAAATLVACNELWGLGLDDAHLQALGRTLGADVPACLVGGIALGTGHGDHMTLLRAGEDPDPVAHHWVLALAAHGLSTPEVFAGLDAAGGPPGGWRPLPDVEADLVAQLTGPADDLATFREILDTNVAGIANTFAPFVDAMREIGRGTHRPYPCGAGAGYLGVAADGEFAACHRFVGDDDLRVQRQRARNRDALALAAGELVRIAPCRVWRQPNAHQQFAHALLGPRKGGRAWLTGLYVALVVLWPYPMVALAVLGWADAWVDFRRRFYKS